MIEENKTIKENKEALRLDRYIREQEARGKKVVYQVLDAWSLMVVYEAVDKASITRWLGRGKDSQVTKTTFEKQRLVRSNGDGRYYFLDMEWISTKEYEEMVENSRKYGSLCLD